MIQLHSSSALNHAACKDKSASTTPKKPLPASPIKIRAGGKFQYKNPATAAAKTKGNKAILGSPSSRYNKPPAMQVQMASTLAKPSMPSIKLYKSSIHTM